MKLPVRCRPCPSLSSPPAAPPAPQRRPGDELAWSILDSGHDQFGRNVANRFFGILVGKHLVDAPNDHRLSNPAIHGALLDALVQKFERTDGDLRKLIRTIVTSRVYALASQPGEGRALATDPAARYLARRAARPRAGGVAESLSRGGRISTSLALAAIVAVLGWRKQFRLRGILLTCIVLGVIAGFLLLSPFAQGRLRNINKPGTMEHVGSRTELWGAAAAVWKEEKLLGVGPGHFAPHFPKYRPERLQSRPVRVHNDYLNTLVDWGLIGMLLAGLMLGTMVHGIIKSWKYSQRTSSDLSAKTSNRAAFVLGSTIGLGSITLHSFVDFNLHIPSNAMLAATLTGLLAAYIRFATERYWVAVRMPVRLTLTVAVGGVAVLLMSEALGQTREHARLEASQSAESFPEQVKGLEKALEIEPNNFETAGILGEIHRRRAADSGSTARKVELKKAAAWRRQASVLNPYDAYSHARLGMALDQLGQTDKAGEYFDRAEQLDRNGYLTVANVGWHKMHIGEYEEAKRYFERVSPPLEYIVQNPGGTPLKQGQQLTEQEFHDAQKAHGTNTFEANLVNGGLVAHRSEKTAQDLARHIRAVYLPYINEQLRDGE